MCLACCSRVGSARSERRLNTDGFLLLIHLQLVLEATFRPGHGYLVRLWAVFVTVQIFESLEQNVVGILAGHCSFIADLAPLFRGRHSLQHLGLRLYL